jgi:hypothetical protein
LPKRFGSNVGGASAPVNHAEFHVSQLIRYGCVSFPTAFARKSLGLEARNADRRKPEYVNIAPIKNRPAPLVLRDGLRTIVEGKRPWGAIDIPSAISRSGWDRYTLTVYPPGTNSSERRLLTFNRQWRVWGIPVVLIIGAVFGTAVPAGAAAIAIFAIYLAGIAVGLIATRKLRKRVRRLTVAAVVVGGGIQTYGSRPLFERSVETLDSLDSRLRLGYLTPAQYEAGWSAVYDSLGPDHARKNVPLG